MKAQMLTQASQLAAARKENATLRGGARSPVPSHSPRRRDPHTAQGGRPERHSNERASDQLGAAPEAAAARGEEGGQEAQSQRGGCGLTSLLPSDGTGTITISDLQQVLEARRKASVECRTEYVIVEVSARAAAEHWDEVWNRRGSVKVTHQTPQTWASRVSTTPAPGQWSGSVGPVTQAWRKRVRHDSPSPGTCRATQEG